MLKYKNKTTHELIEVINSKNHTIYKLNGQIHYLKHLVNYYKQKSVRKANNE